MTRLWTIGHSTRTLEEFIAALASFGIKTVADVRRFPASRRNPQYQTDKLKRGLHQAGIAYVYLGDELGGFRKPTADSPNVGLRNPMFRGYADWMNSDVFRAGIAQLLEVAKDSSAAVMCAERPVSNCHRGLVADYLILVHGCDVMDILDVGDGKTHVVGRGARRTEDGVVYERPEGRTPIESFESRDV